MTQLRDANIVQVLGVISSAPVAVVVEYMQHGDLFQFLQKHELDTSEAVATSLRRNSRKRPRPSHLATALGRA